MEASKEDGLKEEERRQDVSLDDGDMFFLEAE